MSEESLIIGGDLNFTINKDEIWEGFSQVDRMGEFFVQKLEPLNLIDAKPTILNPTQWNNKKGGDIVSKCIDQFLVGSQFFQYMDRIHTWVGSSSISDHSPIFFQFDLRDKKPSSPF